MSIQSPPGNDSKLQDSRGWRHFSLSKVPPAELSPGKLIPPLLCRGVGVGTPMLRNAGEEGGRRAWPEGVGLKAAGDQWRGGGRWCWYTTRR